MDNSSQITADEVHSPAEVDQCIVDESHSVPEETEPCPTPLAWQQVLESFRSESRWWQLDRGSYSLQGRTWGEGQPLYFLNGLGGNSELFALMVWLLHEDFQCVVFDYPSGDSGTGKNNPLSVNTLSEDLFVIADFHEDQRINLFATSFGSAVALHSILEQPDRIDRVILQAGFAYRQLTFFERALFRVGQYLPGSLNNVPFRHMVQLQNHQPWFPPYDSTRWQFFLENTGQLAISDLAIRAAAIKDFDLRARLPAIKNPVLLVRAEGDGHVADVSQDELEQGLSDCHVEQLHTSGQIPYLTHPHRLVKLVRSFLLSDSDTVVEASGNP